MKEQIINSFIFIAAAIGLGVTLSGILYVIGWLAQLSNEHPILSILGLSCLILFLIFLLKGDI